MTVFVDTSAFLAVLNSADQYHPDARVEWQRLIREDGALVCTDYVLLETLTLAQHRLGMAAVRALRDDVLPVITIEWVESRTFEIGLTALLAAGRKRLSLVDCISFEVMRSVGLRNVFTFDDHFRQEGFNPLPNRIEAPDEEKEQIRKGP
ncbi:MAG: PIN domain-containing protein [Acidobacteria bacterium]|nr:MAG: PIN domain-containing protein [Acidobacteriota bacterium]